VRVHKRTNFTVNFTKSPMARHRTSPMTVAAAAAADETNQSAPAALEPSTLPARTFRTKSIERMMLNTRDTPKTPNYPPMPISFTLNCADGGPPMASRSRHATGEHGFCSRASSEQASELSLASPDPPPMRPKSTGERSGSARAPASARPWVGPEVLAARYKKVWGTARPWVGPEVLAARYKKVWGKSA